MLKRPKNKSRYKNFKDVFNEVWEFVIINILVGLVFIILFLFLDAEFIDNKLNNTTFLKMETLVAIFFIIVQILIFFLLVLKKYKQNHKSIESLLKDDENNMLELKSSVRWDYNLNRVNKELEHSILKTIAGFLNADGGTLLIGVSDEKKILGLQMDYKTLKRKDKDGFVQYLTKIITHNLGNNVIHKLSIRTVKFEGKDICRIEVSPDKHPVFVSNNGKDEFFIRTANITIPLSVKETYFYLQKRNLRS